MPCHPDRVRRNHETDEETAAYDRLFIEVRQRIADEEAADSDPDVTANVIEGDHDDLWGV